MDFTQKIKTFNYIKYQNITLVNVAHSYIILKALFLIGKVTVA